jgi:predicted small metal-binding protein
MMSISCKDMGVDCHYTAHGATKDEVKKELMDHAKMAHPEVLEVSEAEMKDMEMKMEKMIKQG